MVKLFFQFTGQSIDNFMFERPNRKIKKKNVKFEKQKKKKKKKNVNRYNNIYTASKI